jgi:hypothetical protein
VCAACYYTGCDDWDNDAEVASMMQLCRSTSARIDPSEFVLLGDALAECPVNDINSTLVTCHESPYLTRITMLRLSVSDSQHAERQPAG